MTFDPIAGSIPAIKLAVTAAVIVAGWVMTKDAAQARSPHSPALVTSLSGIGIGAVVLATMWFS